MGSLADWRQRVQLLQIGLPQDAIDNFARNVGQSEISSLVAIGHLLVIDAQLMQNRGVQIMDVDWILRDVVAEFVGFAIDHATFDTGTGHPLGVTAGMMIAAVVGFG